MQKAGTTSLANQLKQHPALSGLDGLPWHESLSKESHYFNGVLGCGHASSALLYRSFFPTILCRWWSENIRGVEKVSLKSLMLMTQDLQKQTMFWYCSFAACSASVVRLPMLRR